ncbi:hypothetical protein [Gilvibacter sp.]|uniref:hypothetical protein n=1 Tax=Gilvibacter sp. TaxID=2729997 RepID=UPI0025B7CF24|nr:hypothetical protein [Gilvibacter sp.]NQX76221.1 hypothetical protein [Gilvibacter sp.]
MKKIITLLLVFMSFPLFAQMNVIYVDAYVLDGKTQQPVEFVNINIVDRNYGTVTQADGSFKLEIVEEQISSADQIEISAIGYAPKVMSMERFYNLMEANNILFLNPYNEAISAETVKDKAEVNGISGVVLSEGAPVQGAVVRVKGSYNEVKTDYMGRFTIEALPGDVLRVDYLTTYPAELVAKAEALEINLETDGELLEEVELRARKERENKVGSRTINTAYGTKDFDALGFSASQITEEQILPSYVVLGQILNKMPGIIVSDIFGPNPIYAFNRSLGTSVTQSTLPIIVIDDMIYEQGINQVPLIDVQNIHSVTTIPGVVGSVRYGSLGRSGVIIIETKTFATAQGKYPTPEEKLEALKATNNDYSEGILAMDDMVKSEYINQLQQASSFDEAQDIYKQQSSLANAYGVEYYLNASKYFEKWNKEFAMKVASRILEEAPNNPKALKSLGYRLQELGDLNGAKSVFQRIAVLNPNDAQSYRDLAYMYKETGEYAKAFSLYKFILDNNNPSLDFTGIQGVAEAEMRQLLSNYKDKVAYETLPNRLLNVGYKKDIRIVFEWNDPAAEFDLQFVSPAGKFFTHKQTRFDNLEAMKMAYKGGYAIQQFEIDDAEPGQWLINLESLNPMASINPTYLKYTIYRNYATPQETKEVGTINLSDLDKKITLKDLKY